MLQLPSIIFLLTQTLTTYSNETHLGNLTDLKKCRWSLLGLEYLGDISKTESKERCQSWTTNDPHKIPDNITDELFLDGSRKQAKNYCRNPTKDKYGPWCYTMKYDLLFESCYLPVCWFSMCRITGPGIEYGGQHQKSLTGRSCKKWSKDRKKVKVNNTIIKIKQYPEINFPEQDVKDAKKNCRNPSGDIGGPWCFVENSVTSQIEREYCDIPFCDDVDCLVYSSNYDLFTHFSNFDGKIENITFSVKLWDPDDVFLAEARLALTTLALPLSGEDIENAGIGIEIYLSNKYVALKYGNAESSVEEIPVHHLIKSTEFTTFSLSWYKGFIQLQLNGKDLFLMEYNNKKILLDGKKHTFQYYSVSGSKILWSFPFCAMDQICDVHVTTVSQFQQFYHLHQAAQTGYDLLVHIRAVQGAQILLTPTPAFPYPNIMIVLKTTDGFSRILLETYPGSPKEVLIEQELSTVVAYWEWKEFQVDIFGDKLQMFMKTSSGLHSIFEVLNDQVRHMRWFSVSSDDAVAHWTFYCSPPDSFKPPPALLPECALGDDELNYAGTQDVTSGGLPCLPWSSKKIIPDNVKDMFTGNESAIEAVNYCRDPTKSTEGTYCYAKSLKTTPNVKKQFCHLRKCKSELCKLAGTGNDFMGVITKSRSGRECDVWLKPAWENVNREVWNDTLFPDIKSGNAVNHCRNPSRNIGGSWCYTTDPDVLMDACNVRDCDWPEGCIIISTAQHKGHKVYILPNWKQHGNSGGLKFYIKEWNADKTDGANLFITNWDYTQGYELQIGAMENEKVILYKDGEVLEEKTFPHLLSIGKWGEFWLQTRKNELMLGFQGIPTPFFHYVEGEGFEPSFISFSTIKGDPIGYAFECNECHTEHVTVHNFKKTYSIGLWSDAEIDRYGNLTINLRGAGIAVIRLTNLPDSGNYLYIELNPNSHEVTLQIVFNNVEAAPVKKYMRHLYTNTSWSTYLIEFDESILKLSEKGKEQFSFFSEDPMIFYWFSVAAKDGSITWSANCDPLDLDGAPRDGGWSEWGPWLCSVTCGGGEGFRSRTCTNPKPNIFGKLCEGEATITGRCNDFECGDISPPTVDLIKSNLRLEHFTYKIDEGQSIILKNNKDLLDLIKKQSPLAFLEWTLNGVYIEELKHRRSISENNLHIKNVDSSDSGVYIVVLNRVKKQRLVLRVITLAVISNDFDVNTRVTKRYILNCKANLLEYIYGDLKLKIFVNETLLKEFDSGMLSVVNSYDIEHMEKKHHGNWKCVVEQSDLDYQWTTNYVKINVQKAPNLLIHLMEDEMTAPIFGWMKTELNVFLALMFIIACAIFVLLAIVLVYLKFCTLPRFNKRQKYEKVEVILAEKTDDEQ